MSSKTFTTHTTAINALPSNLGGGTISAAPYNTNIDGGTAGAAPFNVESGILEAESYRYTIQNLFDTIKVCCIHV